MAPKGKETLNRSYQAKPGIAGLIFLAAVFIEIAGFIVVGSEIGVLATLGLIVLSMLAGCILLRLQGLSLLTTMQKELAAGKVPDREIAHGALMILGAILLIIPGFVSDIIGILLFIPPVRDVIWRFISKRVSVKTEFRGNFRREDGQTIDLDADDYHSSDPDHSPWKKNDSDRLFP